MKKLIEQRMCIGCRTVKHKSEMIKIIKDTKGHISIDLSGKKAGHGAYLCKDIKCLKIAIKKHQLDRSFKVKVDNIIYKELEEYLIGTIYE